MSAEVEVVAQPPVLRLEDGGLLLRRDAARLVELAVQGYVQGARQRNGSAGAPLEYLAARLRASVSGTPEVSGEAVGASSAQHQIDARTAARLLGCTDRHVRGIARSLGGQQFAGRWVFDQVVVEAYRDQRDKGKASG